MMDRTSQLLLLASIPVLLIVILIALSSTLYPFENDQAFFTYARKC